MGNPFEESDNNNEVDEDLEYGQGDLEYHARKSARDQDFLDDEDEDENEKLILARKCCNNRVSSSSTHLGLALAYWILALYLKACCIMTALKHSGNKYGEKEGGLPRAFRVASTVSTNVILFVLYLYVFWMEFNDFRNYKAHRRYFVVVFYLCLVCHTMAPMEPNPTMEDNKTIDNIPWKTTYPVMPWTAADSKGDSFSMILSFLAGALCLGLMISHAYLSCTLKFITRKEYKILEQQQEKAKKALQAKAAQQARETRQRERKSGISSANGEHTPLLGVSSNGGTPKLGRSSGSARKSRNPQPVTTSGNGNPF